MKIKEDYNQQINESRNIIKKLANFYHRSRNAHSLDQTDGIWGVGLDFPIKEENKTNRKDYSKN